MGSRVRVVGQVDNRVMRPRGNKQVEMTVRADAYSNVGAPIVIFRPEGMPEGVYGHLCVHHKLAIGSYNYFTSFAAARRALVEILALKVDWSQSREELARHPDVGVTVREIIEKHGGREIPRRTIERLAKKEQQGHAEAVAK
jgi:hypothetical protein